MLSRTCIEMIARYIVAILIIYSSHLTDAKSNFESRKKLIKEHLKKEKPAPAPSSKKVSERSSPEELVDIVCDELDETEKQLICDEMMRHLIHKDYGPVFESYSAISSLLPVPKLVDSNDPYQCAEISIKNLGMKKRMFWCKSRWYNKRESFDYGDMEGFFCAGSRTNVNRVYAFRPPRTSSKRVSPVGEMNGVTLLLRKLILWSLK